jgi:hypothetical protein
VDGEPTATSDVWELATRQPSELAVPVPAGELALARPASTPEAVVQFALGLADLLLDGLLQALGRPPGAARTVGDVGLGVAWGTYRASAATARLLSRPLAPVVRLAAEPPLVPRSLQPRSLADQAATTWRSQREASRRHTQAAWDVTVPQVLDAAVAPLDVTDVVLDEVDLRAVARAVLQQLDLTQIVLEQVDLEAVATAVLDQLDLTQIVLEQVDLEAVATAVLDQLDLTQIARDRVDLATLSEEVIDAVDLPEIIRESTGSVASESVRSIRMQSIGADEGVQRIVDRVLAWRKGRDTDAPRHSAAQGGGADAGADTGRARSTEDPPPSQEHP